MSLRSDALYNAVLSDVLEYSPGLPVGDHEIPPDVSIGDYRCLVLLRTLLKKWVPRDSKLADTVAKTRFFASNKSCEDWQSHFEFESDYLLYGEFRKEIDQFLHRDGMNRLTSYSQVLERGRTGPGSAVGARGQSMYAKLFSSPLTTTSENLYLLYRSYIQKFPIWIEAENHRYTRYGAPTVIDCSNTSFVPKTRDTSRMICVEPNLNMFFQLGLGRLLEEWMEESFGISMDTQPDVNRRLARIGSSDGSFSTIDLSSASDSISISLCREIFPSWFFETLMELRSPNTVLDGSKVRLEMISTMGNGFTFPLQTLIFSSIIRASHRVAGIPVLGGVLQNWSCFGDDLICDTRAFRNVKRLLSMTGFSVNPSKTFFEGAFRESCGTDWLFGQPVRGVYIKRLDSVQDICITINLLNEWSAISGVPLIRACSLLVKWLYGKFLPVPYAEGNNTGVRVPLTFLRKNKYRFDSNFSILYRRFQSKPCVIRIGETGIVSPRGIKELDYNPSGLLNSFLMGEVRNSTYTVRHDHVKYYTRSVCTPFWDYAPQEFPLDRGVAPWPRWESAVLINLSNP